MWSIESIVGTALLVINAVLLASRWVADREAGETDTKETITVMKEKTEELCDRQDELDRVLKSLDKIIHDRMGKVDSKFVLYVTKETHNNDIAHLREIITLRGGAGV